MMLTMTSVISYSDLAELSREHVNFETDARFSEMLAEAKMFGAPVVWSLVPGWTLPVPTLALFGPLRLIPMGLA